MHILFDAYCQDAPTCVYMPECHLILDISLSALYYTIITKVIDDPTGNSYIENKLAPQEDPNLNAEHYERSELQNRQLGAATVTEV